MNLQHWRHGVLVYLVKYWWVLWSGSWRLLKGRSVHLNGERSRIVSEKVIFYVSLAVLWNRFSFCRISWRCSSVQFLVEKMREESWSHLFPLSAEWHSGLLRQWVELSMGRNTRLEKNKGHGIREDGNRHRGLRRAWTSMGSSNSMGSGLTWTHACLTYLGSKGSAREPALKLPSGSLETKSARTRLLLHTNSYSRESFRPLLLSEIILPPMNLHQWRKRPRGNSEAEAEASPLGGSSGKTWHPQAREGI